MLETASVITIFVALISLLGTIMTAVLSGQKFSKQDAIEMEHRLTSIENVLNTKLEPIWNVIIGELPKILISPHTPDLDKLLVKYVDDKKNMCKEEFKQLADWLDHSYIQAVEGHDSGRAMAIALVRASIEVI